MAVTIPGLNLSILRGATQGQAGQPILISGRFTAFGIGVPALIRVFLEGPDYNPEQIHFDAASSPFSGDYSLQVVPPKDGTYKVFSQAYPVPLLPTGPAFPEPLLLLPPIAESTQPPLVVGAPAAGGVNAQLPSGSQFLSTPQLTPIEISIGAPGVSVGAPAISIIQPSAGFPTYGIPTPPPLAPAAVPTTYIPPTPPAPIVYPPYYPEAPTPPAVPELPAVPKVPALPELPEVTALQLPTFPSLPTPGILGAPTSTLPSQMTIGE